MAKKCKKISKDVQKNSSAAQVGLGGALSNGRIIFEQILRNYKCRDVISLWANLPYDAPQDVRRDVILYEVALLEGLISYYHEDFVSDDDLDAVRDIMSKVCEDIDVYADDDEVGLLHMAYIRACMCLKMRHVVSDDDWMCAAKSMTEVIDAMSQTGRWGRIWSQVQHVPDYDCLYHEFIPDMTSRDASEVCEENELRERIKAALSTLSDCERQSLNFALVFMMDIQ